MMPSPALCAHDRRGIPTHLAPRPQAERRCGYDREKLLGPRRWNRLRGCRQKRVETREIEESLDVAAGIGNLQNGADSSRHVEDPNQLADAGGVDVGQPRQIQQNSPLTASQCRLDFLAQLRIHGCLESPLDLNSPRLCARLERNAGGHFLDDCSSCGSSDQPAALPVSLGEEVLAQCVNGCDPHQVERHSAMWLLARGSRPASRQFADPRASQSTVKSKGGDCRCVSFNGNHEHIEQVPIDDS